MATTKTTTKKKVKSADLEASVFTQEGKKSGSVTLPGAVFGEGWNADLVHQVVVAMQANARTPVAHARERDEVSGGGKKPYAQKGTGRARHGSTRSPIWRHGGKAHGPRNDKNYAQKLNRKVRAKALATVLSKKWKDGRVLFIDALNFAAPKAKDARAVLTNLGTISGYEPLATRRKNAALVILGTENKSAVKSFSNFGNILVAGAKDINPVEIMTYQYVVIVNPKEAVEAIASKWN
jgi:large subunit ribosomal protein L4